MSTFSKGSIWATEAFGWKHISNQIRMTCSAKKKKKYGNHL
jgi:hypothetical protein